MGICLFNHLLFCKTIYKYVDYIFIRNFLKTFKFSLPI